jgi:hypothetical protein
MLMFTKISIAATITNTDNILMDQVLLMAGQMVLVLQARLEGESAELAINATSSGRNAMDRHLVLTVLASFSPQVSLLWIILTLSRIWIGLRIYQGAKEARQGVSQRPRPASSSGGGQWTKVTYKPNVRGAVSYRVTE